MNKTINDIFDKYFADCEAGYMEAERRRLERARRRAEHDKNLHSCGFPPPAVIDLGYIDYAKDSAAGLNTD